MSVCVKIKNQKKWRVRHPTSVGRLNPTLAFIVCVGECMCACVSACVCVCVCACRCVCVRAGV